MGKYFRLLSTCLVSILKQLLREILHICIDNFHRLPLLCWLASYYASNVHISVTFVIVLFGEDESKKASLGEVFLSSLLCFHSPAKQQIKAFFLMIQFLRD